MSMKSILSAREFTAKKSFFFTVALSLLCLIGKAYGKDAYISIKNSISEGPYYSDKGYLVEANGDGSCMYGVYSPSSVTAKYDDDFHSLGIHYKASNYCAFHSSVQNFKVINKDTGNIIGMFTWKKKPTDTDPVIMITKDPDNFMIWLKDVTLSQDREEMHLYLRCGG